VEGTQHIPASRRNAGNEGKDRETKTHKDGTSWMTCILWLMMMIKKHN